MRGAWPASRAGTSRWQARLGRVRAWAHMLLVDHGVFRLVYLNQHRVSDAAVALGAARARTRSPG